MRLAQWTIGLCDEVENCYFIHTTIVSVYRVVLETDVRFTVAVILFWTVKLLLAEEIFTSDWQISLFFHGRALQRPEIRPR